MFSELNIFTKETMTHKYEEIHELPHFEVPYNFELAMYLNMIDWMSCVLRPMGNNPAI